MDSLSLTSLDKPAAFIIARISMSRVVACSRHLHLGRLIPSVMLFMSDLFRKNLPATNSIVSATVKAFRPASSSVVPRQQQNHTQTWGALLKIW